MPIPVPSSLVANAVPFQADLTAVPVAVCRQDPTFGAKALSLQYNFASNTVFITNLQNGLPAISQVSSMYMDASGCANNVYVIFPDTGYQVQVAAGKTLLCPVFTTKGQLPSFYVVSNTGGVTSSDLFNLILLNFFIPEFASP